MDTSPDPQWVMFIKILIFIGMLVVSALLSAEGSAAQFVNRSQLAEEAEKGDKRAGALQKLLADTVNFSLTVQVVVTFFSIIASAGLTPDLTKWAVTRFFPAGTAWALSVVFLIVCGLVCLIFLVIARVFPRQLALQHEEGVALALAGFARFFVVIGTPFVAVTRGVTNLFLLLTRQETGFSRRAFSEDDVLSMLDEGQESGAIKEEGRKMVDAIFAFDDKLAYEVMTPRTDVFAIDINAPASDYIADMMGMRYSRIPVYEDDFDNIIGILNLKDYMMKAWEYGFDNVHIDKILREAILIPETKNIDALFFELQKKKQHIAVLIDEYGGFSGIVTMEDLIEEIVGDIDDEYDEEEPVIEKVDENTYYINGAMDLDDVNEEIGTDLASENNETVGGLLIDILGEIPDDKERGRKVTWHQYTFTIESVRDRRIERVLLQIDPDWTPVEEEDEKGEKGEKREKEADEPSPHAG